MTNTKAMSVIAVFGFTFISGYGIAAETIKKEAEVSVSFQRGGLKNDSFTRKEKEDARIKHGLGEYYYHTEDATRDNAPDASERNARSEGPTF